MITVLDIGGRFGVHRSWLEFDLLLRYFLCEADGEEAERLRNLRGGAMDSNLQVSSLNVVVAEDDSQGVLHVYESADLTSLYELNPGRSYRYGNEAKRAEVEVATVSLDSLARLHDISPDFLSIDAQGASLPILRGGPNVLQKTLAVRCEVELFEMYRAAPLMHEVVAFMSHQEFELVRTEMCGPGYFGISSEMNEFSVSPWDARPSSCDAIFVNAPLVRKLFREPPAHDVRLIYLIAFLLHNGCGYLGLEYLSELAANDGLQPLLSCLEAGEQEAFRALVGEYLAIPRRGINAGFSAEELMSSIFGADHVYKRARPSLAAKLLAIYDTWSPECPNPQS